jgi:hypothetical protein
LDTPQYILDLLQSRSRELQLAEPHVNSDIPREVYKDKKIKRYKDISRDQCEDNDSLEVSTRPVPCQEAVASEPVTLGLHPSSLEETSSQAIVSQKAFGNDITPARSTSRYTGISVQHARTKKGIKLTITLQTQEEAEYGYCALVTAELKRYDRLREVRAREQDSTEFRTFLDTAKEQIRINGNQSVCLGRLHQRGKRSAWLYDTMAVGTLDGDIIRQVSIYIEGEIYQLELNQEISRLQQQHYYSVGILGSLISNQVAPRISDLPRVKFGG